MIMLTPWLSRPVEQNDADEADTPSYEALTPTELEPEKARSYIDALNFAHNHTDIRNIAVTGPYGAGKSSVLKTWCKSKGKAIRVLTVSLADFDMQKAAADTDTDGKNEKTAEAEKSTTASEKTIEYSILQQILYKNKKNELPYSRIERISGVTFCQILKSASVITGTLLIAGLALFFVAPDYITSKFSLSTVFSRYLLEHTFSVRLPAAAISVVASLWLLLYQLHRTGIFDRKVSLDKVDILKGAVTTKASAPSLLNVYIDEIVYFFDTTKYDVVIFEDLDRLNNSRIFIKLREINQIINSCLSERKTLKFIYAVRDDIFSSAESQTKFFDFVMPVIPVMDNENASEHFGKKFTDEEKNHKGMSECINRMATFIPNMRVLHNITNEFRMSQNIVNNRENIPKLLAMIAYKNLCPEDYHGIDKKQGVVFDFINAFVGREVHKDFFSDIDKDITSTQEDIGKLEIENNSSRKELRKELLSTYVTDFYINKIYFNLSGVGKFKRDAVVDDEDIFLEIINSQNITLVGQGYVSLHINVDESDVEILRRTYEERCILIENNINGDVFSLKNKLYKLDDSKRNIRNATVSDIVNRMRKSGFRDWVKKNAIEKEELDQRETEQLDFIYFLLSSGYLSTDYMSFRSIFMPGGLSENDNAFIKSVMAGDDADDAFGFPIDNTSSVVARLKKLGVIERENAQHPAVILWLLECEPETLYDNTQSIINHNDSNYTVSILKLIQADFNLGIRLRYLNVFLSDEKILVKLLNHLLASNQREFVQETTAYLLCLTNDTNLWALPAVNGLAGELIDSFPELITTVPEGYCDVFFNTLKNNSLSVSHIPCTSETEYRELIRKIVTEDVFKYSSQNLENIYLTLEEDDSKKEGAFFDRPLSCLESLRIESLDKNIWNNIGDFISSLFIKSTETDRIPQLLDPEKISAEDAAQIITSMTFQIESIESIKNRTMENTPESSDPERSIYSMLLSYDRILPSTDNLIHLLNDESGYLFNDVIVWVNKKQSKFYSCNATVDESGEFEKYLFNFTGSAELSEDALLSLMKCFNVVFPYVPESLTFSHAETLISKGYLAPTMEILTGLYKAVHNNDTDSNDEKERKINILQSNLIALRPTLLIDNTEDILSLDSDFDTKLARKIFDHPDIGASIKAQALLWIRDSEYDLPDTLFVSLPVLVKLSPVLKDDALRLALLRTCLKAGDTDEERIRLVLTSFDNKNYHQLLPRKNTRRFQYEDNLWELAELLSDAGLIAYPEKGEENADPIFTIKALSHSDKKESEK